MLERELPLLLSAELQAGRPTLGPNQLTRLKPLLARAAGAEPMLYGIESIVRENGLWESEGVEFYLGTPSTAYPPGDIDPRKAVIIGDAKPDSPIALDYRTDPPRVVYLGDVGHETYWLELAPSYDDLVAKLRDGAHGG